MSNSGVLTIRWWILLLLLHTEKFVITLFGAVAQLERDIIIERTTAGLKNTRRRGIQLGRKKGLGKEAKQKSKLAASDCKGINFL